jgi:DNA-binding beta-propeller fold protein YncE
MYVANDRLDCIELWTTSGQMVNPFFIQHLNTPEGLALDGQGHLFVAELGGNLISEYTTSGEAVNASLITGLSWPTSVALDGQGHIFVANQISGTVGEYTVDGETINASLVSGLSSPQDLVVVVPEPSSLALLVLGTSIFAPRRRVNKPTLRSTRRRDDASVSCWRSLPPCG